MFRNNFEEIIKKLQTVHKITTVYDIGANKGNWTFYYEKKLPQTHFYMFEANPNLHFPSHVKQTHTWINAVLSNECKVVDFFSINGTGDSYYKELTSVYNNCVPKQLKTNTLDNIIKESKLPYPQIVKLDTQGSEMDILQGSTETLKHVEVLVIELSTFPYNNNAPVFSEYMTFLLNNNFVPVGINEIHHVENILAQIDVVFLRKDIKIKLFGNNKLILETKNDI